MVRADWLRIFEYYAIFTSREVYMAFGNSLANKTKFMALKILKLIDYIKTCLIYLI